MSVQKVVTRIGDLVIFWRRALTRFQQSFHDL